jgi:opacity protein-like surface antigen
LRSLALAGVLASVAASGASAQYQTGPVWEITAFNGYYIASDLYTTIPGGSGVGEANIGLDNSYMYGARLGLTPNPRFTAELVYTHAGSDVKLNNTFGGYNATSLGRLNFNSYDLDFLFLQPSANPKLSGYFTLGFGWTITDPQLELQGGTPPTGSTGPPESNSLFAWNFGIGAKVDMNDRLALRLEGRWRVTDTGITTSSGVYCDYWGYCYGYASDWYNSGELTAGLTIKLGGS